MICAHVGSKSKVAYRGGSSAGKRSMVLKATFIAPALLCTGLLCWAGAKLISRGGGAPMGQTKPADDELSYLIEASERLAPDKTQVDREMEAWMDGLAPAELAELAQLYRRADAAGHMTAATGVFRADPPADQRRKHRLFLLFVLFDELGKRGLTPFDSFRVGYRAVPERVVDWSELPEDLRWVIAPAEKYGSLQFESRILDCIDAMDESERAEVRAFRMRFEADHPRLCNLSPEGSFKVGTAAHRIYYLGFFFAHFGWNDDAAE